MDLSKLASLSVGLAAFIGGMWILLQIIKALRRNNHHDTKQRQQPLVIDAQPPRIATAGEQATSYWEKRYDAIDNKLKSIAEALDRIERGR
jgi:hypothetical protein